MMVLKGGLNLRYLKINSNKYNSLIFICIVSLNQTHIFYEIPPLKTQISRFMENQTENIQNITIR